MQRNNQNDVEAPMPLGTVGRIAVSAGAHRMRRHRDRRHRRVRWLAIELRESEIDELIRRGFLALSDRGDRLAIVRAVHAFLDRSFEHP